MFIPFSALMQDFTVIRGQWGTAASLSVLLCQCCVGLELPDDQEYTSFLPNVVESVLTIATKLLDNHVKAILVCIFCRKVGLHFD